MEYALEMNNVVKEYKDFTLDRLSLSVPRGCVVGFIGENGAGKTTAIKAALNLINVDQGEIRLLGQSLREFRAWEKIGYVPDVCRFPSALTVAGLEQTMRHIYHTWDSMEFQHYLRKFQLDPKKKIKELSRGNSMKLSIAVALSHRAELLVLDEATGGLDPVVRDEILDEFREFIMDENHAVLMSSHIVSDLERICDYIALIHHGKLKFCEEKDALLEKYALLRCSEERLTEVDPAAIQGVRRHEFGAEALVIRDKVNPAFPLEKVSIEDIMIYLYKEEKNAGIDL